MNLSNYVTTNEAVPLWEKWSGKKAVKNKRQLFSHHCANGNFERWAKLLDPPLEDGEFAARKLGRGDWYIHKRLIQYFALNPPAPGSSPESEADKCKAKILQWIAEGVQSRRCMASWLDRTPESVSRYLAALLKDGKITRDENGVLSTV